VLASVALSFSSVRSSCFWRSGPTRPRTVVSRVSAFPASLPAMSAKPGTGTLWTTWPFGSGVGSVPGTNTSATSPASPTVRM